MWLTIGSYALVAGLGLLMGFFDVCQTFRDGYGDAYRSWCAWALTVLNGVVAAVVLLIIYATTDWRIHPLLLAAAVGTSFNVLIRTKFLVGRDLGTGTGAEGLGVDVGLVYDRLSQLLKKPIDDKVISIRQPLINSLARQAPDADWLKKQALDRVQLSFLLKPDEKSTWRDRISSVVTDSGYTDPDRRDALALVCCEIGGTGYVKRLHKQLGVPLP